MQQPLTLLPKLALDVLVHPHLHLVHSCFHVVDRASQAPNRLALRRLLRQISIQRLVVPVGLVDLRSAVNLVIRIDGVDGVLRRADGVLVRGTRVVNVQLLTSLGFAKCCFSKLLLLLD